MLQQITDVATDDNGGSLILLLYVATDLDLLLSYARTSARPFFGRRDVTLESHWPSDAALY